VFFSQRTVVKPDPGFTEQIAADFVGPKVGYTRR